MQTHQTLYQVSKPPIPISLLPLPAYPNRDAVASPQAATAQPAKSAKRIYLTERDLEILQAIGTARYMTAPQVEALFWCHLKGVTYGTKKACQRRLRLLTHHHLLRRIELPVKRGEGSKPYIYALDRRGAELLMQEVGIDPAVAEWRPRSREENYPFLQHLLDTTDFRIALLRACEARHVTLVSWTDEREIKSQEAYDHVELLGPLGGPQKVAVIPDASFVISRGDRQARYVLEIDRGTVTIAPTLWNRRGWIQKIKAYMEYYQSGLYEKRYQTTSMLVLTITTSQARLAQMKETTEEVGGDSRFLFTTFENAQADMLLTGEIWYRAAHAESYSLLPQDSPSQPA